jgi:hypothetical protein
LAWLRPAHLVRGSPENLVFKEAPTLMSQPDRPKPLWSTAAVKE